MRQMHTKPEIKSTSGRAYIEYYYNGERQREYNGNRISLPLFPNRAKDESDRSKLLSKLRFEFEKALEKGWNPLSIEPKSEPKIQVSLEESINTSLSEKLADTYSRTYKRDLSSLATKLLAFLSKSEKKAPLEALDGSRIMDFLNTFSSSNRNYMNKRQTLNVLLPGTLLKTKRKKSVETLHGIYQKDEMLKIFDFLKKQYPKLYIVALLAYGCFLRPHEECRLLQRKHVRDRKIYLSGDENKGKRIRVVHIPDYVYAELVPYMKACQDANSYLLTGSEWLLNNDYFKTQWSRAKKKLAELNLIQENQTLYSFRHTGAVNSYRKTKDIHILQQLLGHSNMIVTLKYLRGLGELNDSQLKASMPEL